MQPRSINPAIACAACCALDGRESAAAPHAALKPDGTVSIQPDDPDAGTVAYFRCYACGLRLQRFSRACALDGWLVVRPRPVLQVVDDR